MKNTIFWFITFAIIATVVGVTVIFTQDFGHEKNENKVWVVKLETGIGGNLDPDDETSFMNKVDQILYYYGNQDIEIHDAIIRIFDQVGLFITCEGGCPAVLDLFLLVDESDVERMLNSGFSIVEGNPKQIGFYSCNVELLNQSISVDNNCSRDGKSIVYFFQLTDNLK